VRRLVLFWNELSFLSEQPVSQEAVVSKILSTINVLRAIKHIRPDLLICGERPMTKFLLGDGTQSLSMILGGDTYREEWRFIASLDNASPVESHEGFVGPNYLDEVTFQERPAIGLSLAVKNDSAVLSFGYFPYWDREQISAYQIRWENDETTKPEAVTIPNLSQERHLTSHAQKIQDYGLTISPSSLVHEGDGFVVRMYANDHPPPHFHVLLRTDTSETVARCLISTLEIMDGTPPSALRRKILEWGRIHAEGLRANWARCRAGERPQILGA